MACTKSTMGGIESIMRRGECPMRYRTESSIYSRTPFNLNQDDPSEPPHSIDVLMTGFRSVGFDHPALPLWPRAWTVVGEMRRVFQERGDYASESRLMEEFGLYCEKVAAVWESRLEASTANGGPGQGSAVCQARYSLEDVEQMFQIAIWCRGVWAFHVLTRLGDPQRAEAVIDPAVEMMRKYHAYNDFRLIFQGRSPSWGRGALSQKITELSGLSAVDNVME